MLKNFKDINNEEANWISNLLIGPNWNKSSSSPKIKKTNPINKLELK